MSHKILWTLSTSVRMSINIVHWIYPIFFSFLFFCPFGRELKSGFISTICMKNASPKIWRQRRAYFQNEIKWSKPHFILRHLFNREHRTSSIIICCCCWTKVRNRSFFEFVRIIGSSKDFLSIDEAMESFFTSFAFVCFVA